MEGRETESQAILPCPLRLKGPSLCLLLWVAKDQEGGLWVLPTCTVLGFCNIRGFIRMPWGPLFPPEARDGANEESEWRQSASGVGAYVFASVGSGYLSADLPLPCSGAAGMFCRVCGARFRKGYISGLLHPLPTLSVRWSPSSCPWNVLGSLFPWWTSSLDPLTAHLLRWPPRDVRTHHCTTSPSKDILPDLSPSCDYQWHYRTLCVAGICCSFISCLL